MKRLLAVLILIATTAIADYTKISSTVGEMPIMDSPLLAEKYYEHYTKSNGRDNFRVRIDSRFSYRKSDFIAKSVGILGAENIDRVRKLSDNVETIRITFYNTETRKAGSGFVHVSLVHQKLVEESTEDQAPVIKKEATVKVPLKKSTFEKFKTEYDIVTKGDLEDFFNETLPELHKHIENLKKANSNPDDIKTIKGLKSKVETLEMDLEETSEALDNKSAKLTSTEEEINNLKETQQKEKIKSMAIAGVVALIVGLVIGFSMKKS